MDRTHIVVLTKNILYFTSTLATHISIPDMNPCSLCEKEIYSLASNPLYKEFTLASCEHIFHQKCLEKYLVNREARCPNKDCNKDIETFLSPELFKGSQDKPTTSTAEDIATKQIDFENPTPVGEDANAIYMNELGLLDGEDLLSKMAKVTSSQIQLPTCKKCSEEISLEFTKPTIFLPCKHVVHYDCIKDSYKMYSTCSSSETISEIVSFANTDMSDIQKKRTRELSTSTEKSSSKKAKKVSGKKVSRTLKQLIEELLIDNLIVGRSLEETGYTADTRGIFLKLSDRIDSTESKNEDTSRDLITSYFDFGEALYNRYKELKPTYGKDGARALVKSKFDCAFKGVRSLYDLGAIKTDKESPLDSDQIKDNIDKLKKKLNKVNTPLYWQLYSDPLASQVISDDSKLVKQLKVNLKKAFEQIKPELMPRVKEMCEEVVSSFVIREYQNIPPEKLTHDGTWKESEKEIASVVRGLFTLLEEIWINPAFNSELAKSLNEGTYQSTVHKVLKPEKEQFGIVGVQIAGTILHLNVLIRDKADIHRYLHIQSAEIPVQLSSADTITKFVETLLFLCNILITNLSLLYHTSASISERQKENSTNLEARLAILEQASLVVDSQIQNSKEVIPEMQLSINNSVLAVDLFNSLVDQQDNADT
ncbi:27085_t:CDS:2, partial [Gigaspora margarita]